MGSERRWVGKFKGNYEEVMAHEAKVATSRAESAPADRMESVPADPEVVVRKLKSRGISSHAMIRQTSDEVLLDVGIAPTDIAILRQAAARF